MTNKPLLLAALPLLLAACAQLNPPDPTATGVLAPTTGNRVTGSVHFVQRKHNVEVAGEVRGLKPGAEHGFHIHEKGDCSSGDGMSAGGHFNPDAMPHGNFEGVVHHKGDLPSLRADTNGVAKFSFQSNVLQVGGGAGDVIGRALVVHRDPDDYTTQPTGNSGPRLACGVITAG
jgi:superoxide dismutase, Cu-Zn family